MNRKGKNLVPLSSKSLKKAPSASGLLLRGLKDLRISNFYHQKIKDLKKLLTKLPYFGFSIYEKKLLSECFQTTLFSNIAKESLLRMKKIIFQDLASYDTVEIKWFKAVYHFYNRDFSKSLFYVNRYEQSAIEPNFEIVLIKIQASNVLGNEQKALSVIRKNIPLFDGQNKFHLMYLAPSQSIQPSLFMLESNQ